MSIQVLRERLGENFTSFLIENDICPECLGNLTVKDSEKVCVKCGLVCGRVFQARIPFNETRTPTNLLAFGKNLGGTIQTKGIWALLANEKNNKHLPLRARFLSIMAHTTDHPKIARMLQVGSELCETRFNFNLGDYTVEIYFGDHTNPENIKFTNLPGKIIRRVGAYVVLANTRFGLRKIAKACFILALHQIRHPYTFFIQKKLEIPEHVVQAVSKIYSIVNNLA